MSPWLVIRLFHPDTTHCIIPHEHVINLSNHLNHLNYFCIRFVCICAYIYLKFDDTHIHLYITCRACIFISLHHNFFWLSYGVTPQQAFPLYPTAKTICLMIGAQLDTLQLPGRHSIDAQPKLRHEATSSHIFPKPACEILMRTPRYSYTRPLTFILRP